MTYEELDEKIKHLKFIDSKGGCELYNFIVDNKTENVLELGFAYGKATAIIAAVLNTMGRGHVDTVDLEIPTRKHFNDPSIEETLSKLELTDYVSVYRESHTYNWWLKKKLQERTQNNRILPLYDLVFIDGAHNWTIDTCAFFLSDRLLKPGGTLLLDDLLYNYYDRNVKDGKLNELEIDSYDPRSRVARVPMSEDELKACHIGLLYEVVVKTHEDYHNFRTSQNGNWGWAQKKEQKKNQSFFKRALQTLKS